MIEVKSSDRFSASDRSVFKVKAVYCPNEEDDRWVEYCNESSGQTYSCRLEAFVSRFTRLLD